MLRFLAMLLACLILVSCSASKKPAAEKTSGNSKPSHQSEMTNKPSVETYTTKESKQPLRNEIRENSSETVIQQNDISTSSTKIESTAKPNTTKQTTKQMNDEPTISVVPTENWTPFADLPDFKETVNQKNNIIPEGWNMLDSKDHDFNGDGLDDIVGVIEHPNVEDVYYPRILFIYFNNGNGYTRNLTNQYLIRTRDEGGFYGDPYQELTAHNNTFSTHAYGGSAWRWSENYIFCYYNFEWILKSVEITESYGPFETAYLFDDYSIGVGKRRYTEESPEKENPKLIEFSIKLDKAPTLDDFAYQTCFSEKIEAPIINSIAYSDGVIQFEGIMPALSSYNIIFHNKQYMIYFIRQTDKVLYIAVYDSAKKHLQMVMRYSDNQDTNIDINDLHASRLYKDRLYWQENILKTVSVRRNGITTEQREVVAIRLVSMKLDGSDKKIIYTANGNYKEGETIENFINHIYLSFEISGDEIVADIYNVDGSSYYRMDLNSTNLTFLGNLPKGEYS